MTKQEESLSQEIEKAVEVLKKGGVIIFPTDTVYGMGCRFDNKSAIARIRNIKGSNQEFPLLISNIDQSHHIVKINDVAKNLAQRFWPGGLTIIVEKASGLGKIGIRIPSHKIPLTLIEKIGVPIIGTSANFHGQKSPTSYEDLDKRLISMVDFVVHGECDKKIQSTVVDSTTLPVRILRRGAVDVSSS